MKKAKDFSVKTFVILAVLTLALCGVASATDVMFNLTDPQFGLSQTVNRTIIVQAESGVSVNGANVLLPFRLTFTTDTNGACVASNLFGSAIGGFYHVTIPAPPQRSDFDIWVQSTNLGLVQASTIIGTFGASTYPAQAFAWSAGVSDARYSASSNQLGSYVQIGQLNSTSNSIVAQIPSTNGFVTAAITNGLATTNYVNSSTSSFVGTNFINGQIQVATNQLATTNFVNSSVLSASNSVSTNALANLIATNNLLISQINIAQSNLNAALAVSSNLLQNTKQPASAWLTNLSTTGAFTNKISAGLNFSLTTNFSGDTVILNATNQTFLTNGLSPWVGLLPSSYMQTNLLPALTNGFAQQSAITSQIGSTNTLILTTVTNLISSSTNTFATTNYVVTLLSFGTNGLATSSFVTNLVTVTSNGLYSIIQSGTNFVYTNLSSLIYGIGLNDTNYTLFSSNALRVLAFQNSTNAASNATNGLPSSIWTLGTASQSNASAFVTPFQLSTNLAGYVTTNQFSTITNGFATVTYVNTLSQNGTNQSISVSNGAVAAAATLASNVTNGLNPWVFSLASASQSNGASFYLASNPNNFWNGTQVSNLFSGFATSNSIVAATNTVTTNLTALIYLIGANATNNDLAVSNSYSGKYILNNNGSATNLIIQSHEIFQTATNITLSTDIIGVRGAAIYQANGTYRVLTPNTLWTNYMSPGYSILFSGGSYYIRTNITSQYQSPSVNTNWTVVLGNGVAPAPVCAYGFYFDVNGVVFLGYFDSTNIIAQVTALASNPTNAFFTSLITNISNTQITFNNTNNVYYGTFVGTNTIGSTNAQYLGGLYYTSYRTTNAPMVTSVAAADSSITVTPSSGSPNTLTYLLSVPGGGGGGTNVQMVFTGTANPNGSVTAPIGAIYNQFGASSNFLFQFVNTNAATGWY